MPDLSSLSNLAGAVRAKAEKLQHPSAPKKWWNITRGTNKSEVYIYDMIGEWGVTASDFVNELRAIEGDVDIHLNSEGGEVYDGLAIYEAILQHKGHKTVYIDSLAASAASFIAMAGDKVLIGKRADIIIHDAMIGGGIVMGSAAQIRDHIQDLEDLCKDLDEMSDKIAGIYAERAGGTPEEWRARMQAGKDNSGTKFSASQAVEVGLADGIIGEEQEDEGPTNSVKETSESTFEWDPTAFANMMKGVFA